MKEFEVNIKLIVIVESEEDVREQAEFILNNEPIFDNSPYIETEIKETGEYI